MVLNCGIGQDSWESLGLQGDPPSHPKGNQSWILIGRTNAEIEPPILWPTDVKNDSLEKTLLLGKIEGRRREDDRGWDGLMESPTRWTWVYPSSRSGQASPGVLQSTGLQRVWHDWATEPNRTYPERILFVMGMFLQQDWGSLWPQHISPIKFAPMHRSQCLAFTRRSVSSNSRGTSILVDIKG